MKRKKIKIWILVLASLFLIAIALSFSSLSFLSSLRIVFGSLFVLFLPGYIITELFLERKDIVETIALSFALSIAIVPLTIFYLNKLGMKITTITSILTILGVLVIAYIVKHRKRLPFLNLGKI